MKSVRIQDIPDDLLPVIGDNLNKEKHCYLNGMPIKQIIIFHSQYRIYASDGKNGGEYRYPLNTDVTIEIY